MGLENRPEEGEKSKDSKRGGENQQIQDIIKDRIMKKKNNGMNGAKSSM